MQTSTRRCEMPQCEKPHVARGLCKTHYNQQHQPNRHPKVTVPCSACGKPVQKDRSAKRWAGTYCSELCRSWHVWGASKSTPLPKEHWALWYGRASEWKPPKPPHPTLLRNTGQCAWCEAPNHRSATSAYCTPRCKDKAKKVRRTTRAHNTVGTYTYAQLVRLWMTFDKRCAYCRKRTQLADIQAEHVTPLSRGGENHIGNLLPSCLPCNADKRDLTLSEWSSDRARRGLEPVVTDWPQDDTRYRHLALTLAA